MSKLYEDLGFATNEDFKACEAAMGNPLAQKKLMFEDVASVGDQIRAYDFAQFGEAACYLEGTVLSKGTCDEKYYACYKIQLTKRLVNGKNVTEKTKDKIWYVPFESSDDADEKNRYPKKITRVMKIKEAA